MFISTTKASLLASFSIQIVVILHSLQRTNAFHLSNHHWHHRRTARRGWLDGLFPTFNPEEQAKADSDRRKQFPEQYPATYELLQEEDGCFLADDIGDARLVRPLLKGTQLEKRKLEVVYDADRDGWNAKSFHGAVDGKGASIVLAKPQSSFCYIGGYNPKGWASYGGARPSVAAFLFYQTASSPTKQFQKLQKIGGGGLACTRDDPDFGVSLGPDGLVIPLQEGTNERRAMSKLGPYYEKGPDDYESVFYACGGINSSAMLESLVVLVGVYEDGEDIPYSGAVMDMTSG
mmetsp:Transcript_29486/g.43711  ORF Transcript_29486/g.43711 Transcript_29486/m.43711 type:complete len:290 (-) Transcript_29486:268-1137(-)